MGKVLALERTSFLIGLLCLGTGSEDTAALYMYQTPSCISAAVGADPIMYCRFPPLETKGIAYISWYRGREELLPSDKHFKRSGNLPAGSASLWIPHVQAEDAGVYICQVGNSTHSSEGNGTNLEVHVTKLDAVALGMYQTPPNISAAVGMELIMMCRFPRMEANGIAFVSWYKDGATLNTDSRLLQFENHTAGAGFLRISNVQTQDAGVFVCEVGNITHSVSGNGTKLEVQVSKVDAAAPGIYQTPPSISAAVGTELIMMCRFPRMEANGIAFVSWYKDGEKLSSESRLLQSENLPAGSSSLRISSVRAQDAGVFVCKVTNITHSVSGNGTKLEVQVTTSVDISILLLRSVLGSLLLLTLVLAVITVNSISGHITRPTGRIRKRKGTDSHCFTE